MICINFQGETLCTQIIDKLKEIGINMDGIIGQGYDGAANMAGQNKGLFLISNANNFKNINNNTN